MHKQSRIEQVSRKRSERNIFLILSGIIALIVLFFFFGVPLLINFTLFIGSLRGQSQSSPTTSTSYVAPPVLDSVVEATNSAQIQVTGFGIPKYKVKLYVNGKYIDERTIDEDKNFRFRNVTLEPGDNDIKAKSVNENKKESDYSQVVYIYYRNKPPTLDVSSPQDNQTFSGGKNQITVAGKTDPESRVTVNDYWAIVDDEGAFSYLLRLQKGENTIKIVSTDDAGNQTSKEMKVTLNE